MTMVLSTRQRVSQFWEERSEKFLLLVRLTAVNRAVNRDIAERGMEQLRRRRELAQRELDHLLTLDHLTSKEREMLGKQSLQLVRESIASAEKSIKILEDIRLKEERQQPEVLKMISADFGAHVVPAPKHLDALKENVRDFYGDAGDGK